MAEQGHSMRCVLGRHNRIGTNRDHGEAPLGHSTRDIDCGSFSYEPQKLRFDTMSSAHTSGVCVGFEGGFLRVPPEKLKRVRRKMITHQQMTPRKMAAILGQVRSFLVALPFLRAFIDQMVQFVDLHRQSGGWDCPHPLPQDLVRQIREVKHCLEEWPGRAFVRVRPL